VSFSQTNLICFRLIGLFLDHVKKAGSSGVSARHQRQTDECQEPAGLHQMLACECGLVVFFLTPFLFLHCVDTVFALLCIIVLIVLLKVNASFFILDQDGAAVQS
jgi:hypothetical protein